MSGRPAANPLAAGQAGSALVMALLFTALLGSLGIALLSISISNLKLGRMQLDVKQAFFLAESAVEHGRRTLGDSGGDFGPRLAEAAGADGVLDFAPTALIALYDDDGTFTGLTGYGDDVPLRAHSPLGEGFFAAFLSNDPIDGRSSLTDSNSRVLVTGVGVGPNHSFRVVEAVVESVVFLPPIPPAAVTLLGEDPSFFGGQANAERYHGEDCYFLGGGHPGLAVGIVGATTDAAEALAEQGMTGPPHKFRSGPFSGAATAVNLLDATEPLVAGAGMGTMDPAWNDCAFLQDLLDKLRDYATYFCDTDNCSLPEALTGGDVVFIDADVQVGPGAIGSGVLVVTGELTILGSSSWSGVVLAIGEGRLRRVGGGNGVISGATIVADIAGPNGSYGDADDCQPAAAGGDPFGNSSYQTVGGGNSDIDFCSRFLFTGPRADRTVSFRQL